MKNTNMEKEKNMKSKISPAKIIEIDFIVDLGMYTWIDGLGIIMDVLSNEEVEIEVKDRDPEEGLTTRYTIGGSVNNFKRAKIKGNAKTGKAISLLARLNKLLLKDFMLTDKQKMKWLPEFVQKDITDENGNLVKIVAEVIENYKAIKQLNDLQIGDFITPLADTEIPDIIVSKWHEVTKIDLKKGRVYFKKYEDSKVLSFIYKRFPQESSISLDRVVLFTKRVGHDSKNSH